MDDPCAPLRLQLRRIDQELRQWEESPAGQGGRILTPSNINSQLASKSVQQLHRERQALAQRLAECEQRRKTH